MGADPGREECRLPRPLARAKPGWELAANEVWRLRHSPVDIEYLPLGLLRHGEGVAACVPGRRRACLPHGGRRAGWLGPDVSGRAGLARTCLSRGRTRGGATTGWCSRSPHASTVPSHPSMGSPALLGAAVPSPEVRSPPAHVPIRWGHAP